MRALRARVHRLHGRGGHAAPGAQRHAHAPARRRRCVPVTSGTATLKDAMNEAIRDWIANVETTHYLIGSAAGPHPYPTLVRELQSVIGREARAQMLERRPAGCPTPSSPASAAARTRSALFHAVPRRRRAARRRRGGRRRRRPARRLDRRRPRLGAARLALLRALRRARARSSESHSISAGLDYPGVGPEHAPAGRQRPRRVRARERRRGARGVPPPVPARGHHPGARVVARAATPPSGWRASSARTAIVLVCLSGRGDKDIDTVHGAGRRSEARARPRWRST